MATGPWVSQQVPEIFDDDKMNAAYTQKDTDGNRPAAAFNGREFVSTDDFERFLDDGGVWTLAMEVDGAANKGCLRTLGTGALQIAAGNHTH